ncbi:hypothetical protein [Selenomonas sp. F0473]|uniref:hypothetical protein n=1 Tax=Selenomonas sp. F0473 TaxID=999423 RepID=UPI00029E688B|nr:hypothetical protein [Selenomonas sp. F0473]EKU72261.1 hypothetical protein HMPREF9161_00946 [Selenomonas sp. F0473]
MGEQKKPTVREVLWRKKRARDRVLAAVGNLCDEAWALFEKLAADRSATARDAVTAREMSLRLRSLAYIIEGEHYIDRIAFELRTKEVYMTAAEVSKAYVSEMVLAFLDGILNYGRRCKWDDKALEKEYMASLEASLEEVRAALTPVPEQAVASDESED